MNREVEIHDSTLAGIEAVDRDVVVRFAPAYVHMSEGRPGVDPGSGWLQDLDLVVREAVIELSPSQIPCSLIAGSLSISGAVRQNLIAFPLATSEPVVFLAFTEYDEALVIRGVGVEAVPRGEARYIEPFPGGPSNIALQLSPHLSGSSCDNSTTTRRCEADELSLLGGRAIPDFVALIDAIAQRPGIYVGRCSLSAISTYLDGYDHALRDTGHSESQLSGWVRSGWVCWVEARFLISHPGWHWTRILLHVLGTDQAAIKALPTLYREFLADREEQGVAGIEAGLRRRLIAEHGQEWYEPSETATTPFSPS